MIQPERGARRRWCQQHAIGKVRNRDLRKLAANGDPEAVQLLALAGASAEVSTSEISRIQRFAVALSAAPNAADAAELVELDLEPHELTQFEARARTEYPDLVAGRLAGLTALSAQAIALLMIRLRDGASSLPATQVAASLKSAADVAERLLGGVAPQFANIEVVLNLNQPEPPKLAELVELASGPPAAAHDQT